MPNIKSAKKRVITDAKKKDHNRSIVSSMRTAIKKANLSIKENDKANSEANVKDAVKKIDKAVTAGVVHKNKAARDKSKLMKKVNEIK